MLHRKGQHFTPEEYLVSEEDTEFRSEYYQGEIFATSGGSANHNRIARNLIIALEAVFEGNACEAFIGDMRLLVKENGLYTYPDIMVICNGLEFAEGRTDTITNPAAIFEVLSKSTEGYDRGVKFELYRALKTLQDYVLIDQAKVHVEHFHKIPDGRWLLTEFNNLQDRLHLKTVGFEVSLERLYQRVNWEES